MPGITGIGGLTTPRADLGEAFWEYMFDPMTFVATKYFAPRAVMRRTGEVPKIIRETLLKAASNVKRKPRSTYERGGYEIDSFTYACEERGFEAPVDLSEIAELVNDFDAEEPAAAIAMWKVMYDLENDVKDLVFDGTTTYTVANGLRTDVSTAWTSASADVIGDVQDAIEAVRSRTGLKPNTLLVPASYVPGLVTNTAIRNAMPDSTAKTIDNVLAFLPLALGIDQVLVAGGVYNTQDLGLAAAASNVSDIWGSTFAAVGLVAPAGSSLATPCVGRTLAWVEDANTDTALMEEYYEDQTRSKVIRARNHCDEVEIEPWFQQLLDIAG